MPPLDSAQPKPASTPAPKRRIALLILVGTMTALGPLGTDTYLPALPAVVDHLEATDAHGQSTLAIYLLGLGLGQLIWGPLSDRVGRRAPLIIGLTAFTLAAVACAFAPSMVVLILARLLMGISGSAGVVISRAIVRDLYEGPKLAQIFARLTIVFAIAPIIGPLFGAFLLQFTDWRGTFIALAGVGVALVLAALAIVPETLTEDRKVVAGRAAQLEAWGSVIRHARFRLYVAILVLVCAGMYLYVTFASLVLQGEWGITEWQFGLIFGINAIAVLTGGQFTAWLVKRVPGDRILIVALSANIVITGLVLWGAVGHWPIEWFDAVIWLFVFQVSISQPLTIALALAPFAKGAGTAAAVQGAVQFTIGSVVPMIIAAIWGTSGIVMGVSLVALGIAALLVAVIGIRTLGRREREAIDDTAEGEEQ